MAIKFVDDKKTATSIFEAESIGGVAEETFRRGTEIEKIISEKKKEFYVNNYAKGEQANAVLMTKTDFYYFTTHLNNKNILEDSMTIVMYDQMRILTSDELKDREIYLVYLK